MESYILNDSDDVWLVFLKYG